MSNTSCLLSNCMAWREISEMLMTSAHATWQLECQTHARMNLVQDPTRIKPKSHPGVEGISRTVDKKR